MPWATSYASVGMFVVPRSRVSQTYASELAAGLAKITPTSRAPQVNPMRQLVALTNHSLKSPTRPLRILRRQCRDGRGELPVSPDMAPRPRVQANHSHNIAGWGCQWRPPDATLCNPMGSNRDHTFGCKSRALWPAGHVFIVLQAIKSSHGRIPDKALLAEIDRLHCC